LNDRLVIRKLTFASAIMNGRVGSIPADGAQVNRAAGIGQNQSLTGTMPKVCFPFGKRSFESVGAAQYDFFAGHVGFGITKQKYGADFDAC